MFDVLQRMSGFTQKRIYFFLFISFIECSPSKTGLSVLKLFSNSFVPVAIKILSINNLV